MAYYGKRRFYRKHIIIKTPTERLEFFLGFDFAQPLVQFCERSQRKLCNAIIDDYKEIFEF